MHAVHVPVLAAAIVLIGAGLQKTWRPVATARAVRTLLRETPLRASAIARAASSVTAVRALGVAEVAVGALVLASTWRGAAWALAVIYAGFALFVIAALATGAPLESCGCFGADDRPPTARHAAVCTAIAALAVAAVTDAGTGPARATLTAGHGAASLVALAGAGVLWALLSGRPARRRPHSRG